MKGILIQTNLDIEYTNIRIGPFPVHRSVPFFTSSLPFKPQVDPLKPQVNLFEPQVDLFEPPVGSFEPQVGSFEPHVNDKHIAFWAAAP